MTCKLDHSDAAFIPVFLCRVCTPREAAPMVADEIKVPELDTRFAKKFAKRKLRKLRAEERRLSDVIDSIAGRDPAMTKKLYEAIKVVERQIEAAVGR